MIKERQNDRKTETQNEKKNKNEIEVLKRDSRKMLLNVSPHKHGNRSLEVNNVCIQKSIF